MARTELYRSKRLYPEYGYQAFYEQQYVNGMAANYNRQGVRAYVLWLESPVRKEMGRWCVFHD